MIATPESQLRSDDAHFTIANLPYGVASATSTSQPHIATRLHDKIFFLADLISQGLLHNLPESTISAVSEQQVTLNALAALPKGTTPSLRTALTSLLSRYVAGSLGGALAEKLSTLGDTAASATMHMPLSIGDFTDFSCSRHHVPNAGEAVLGEGYLL